MALIWADDFKSFGDDEGAMSDGVYGEVDSITLVADPDPLASGNVVRHLNLGNGMRFVYPSSVTTAGYAGRFWFETLPTSVLPAIIQFRNASNAAQVTIEVTTTGAIQARRGFSSTGTILGTSNPVITANAWNHIEVKVLVSDTVGTVHVQVNGIEVLALTGQDTLNSGSAEISQIFHGSTRIDSAVTGSASNSATGLTIYRKDAVYWDTSGTQNNDFMGTVSVLRLVVDADSSFNWTPSTGTTGYDLLDEAGPDDADYISADSTPPAASVFTFGNLPVDVTSVRGLISLVRAKKTDGGDGNLQVSLTSNAADDLGSDRPITTADTYYWDVSELSPDTGVAWTPSEVDDATVKIDRTL
jgi:hypothetical protein